MNWHPQHVSNRLHAVFGGIKQGDGSIGRPLLDVLMESYAVGSAASFDLVVLEKGQQVDSSCMHIEYITYCARTDINLSDLQLPSLIHSSVMTRGVALCFIYEDDLLKWVSDKSNVGSAIDDHICCCSAADNSHGKVLEAYTDSLYVYTCSVGPVSLFLKKEKKRKESIGSILSQFMVPGKPQFACCLDWAPPSVPVGSKMSWIPDSLYQGGGQNTTVFFFFFFFFWSRKIG